MPHGDQHRTLRDNRRRNAPGLHRPGGPRPRRRNPDPARTEEFTNLAAVRWVANNSATGTACMRDLRCVLAAARYARILRSPKLQSKSGRAELGSSRPSLRTPASAGHPSQSSTGLDIGGGDGERTDGCPVRGEGCTVRVKVAPESCIVQVKVARRCLGLARSAAETGWMLIRADTPPGSGTSSYGAVVISGPFHLDCHSQIVAADVRFRVQQHRTSGRALNWAVAGQETPFGWTCCSASGRGPARWPAGSGGCASNHFDVRALPVDGDGRVVVEDGRVTPQV